MFTIGVPPIQETWTICPNNRITYTSLTQVMSELLYGIKTFLVVNGYTVKGSCDGTSASMSGVDYWTSAAACTTRTSVVAGAQSWVVLVDGSGVDILLTYQGGTNDVVRMSFSNGALFILAGTVTHQPTATDETIVFNASVIDATLSTHRVWHGWVSSDSKMFRIVVCRQQSTVAAFGVEKFIPLYDTSLVVSKCWGFFYTGGNLIGTASGGINALTGFAQIRGGYVRYNNATNILVGGGLTLGASSQGSTSFGVEKPEAQGSNSHIVCGILIASSVAAFSGVIGLRIDWLYSFHNANLSLGDFYGSREWVALSPGSTTKIGGALWPWNGSSYFLMA